MSRIEILIGGFGGQGILLAGWILGNAAMLRGYNSTYLPSYGPEARGGRCASRVVIDCEREVDCPLVRNADYLIVMYQEAYDSYIDLLKPGGVLIYDNDLVTLDERAKKAKIYAVPATKMAESVGRRIVANIVMIGAFTAISNLIDKETVKRSVIEGVRGRYVDLNVRAFEVGYEYGRKLVESEKK
ncbi:MAG: 2-oxoacid:acceptor oxidoreductase family protein [Crenarchaeota archaeon]|nr:2-oxoacid:acceptor oxidoreductase family protein [Thermoproteota archaeon]MCR8453633.1 2-oxoacid:acceptor oxidoreductase family protein [Thermoproteota archaeon]MCR8455693.1 2-oxoacid:acceptor oxidoreductase family protein [Thermoproteota archaeon]MCR8462892.1 2-oxoacid:acceptor oxidoreductase family protein [Thermoproteota archaeon]MCR8470364.1 2-oxoacid:acceptor oxidoreductase family protein [Thermoproteota archaeon]